MWTRWQWHSRPLPRNCRVVPAIWKNLWKFDLVHLESSSMYIPTIGIGLRTMFRQAPLNELLYELEPEDPILEWNLNVQNLKMGMHACPSLTETELNWAKKLLFPNTRILNTLLLSTCWSLGLGLGFTEKGTRTLNEPQSYATVCNAAVAPSLQRSIRSFFLNLIIYLILFSFSSL